MTNGKFNELEKKEGGGPCFASRYANHGCTYLYICVKIEMIIELRFLLSKNI